MYSCCNISKISQRNRGIGVYKFSLAPKLYLGVCRAFLSIKAYNLVGICSQIQFGSQKTKGIKNANDPYLQKLKDTKGDRAKIAKIEEEILKLKNEGKIKPQRWKKLKAWIKLAKDGRLFNVWDMIGILLEFEVKKTFNCGSLAPKLHLGVYRLFLSNQAFCVLSLAPKLYLGVCRAFLSIKAYNLVGICSQIQFGSQKKNNCSPPYNWSSRTF